MTHSLAEQGSDVSALGAPVPDGIRITVDGRLAVTSRQATAAFGLTPLAMRQMVSRHADALTRMSLDGNCRIFFFDELRALVRSLPGSPGRPSRSGGGHA